MLSYPSVEKIIELNLLALTVIKVKKADSPKVLSHEKIRHVLEECKNSNGGIYDKATILMKGLIQKHAFASGNRRTAFLATKYFLIMNDGKINIQDDPKNARIMIGIREGYYSDDEIKRWIKNGKIKKFER